MTLFRCFAKQTIVLTGLAVLIAGCASSSTDSSIPVAAATPRSGAPTNTGAYPNINIVPTANSAQLTDGESQGLRNELLSEKNAQQRPGESAQAYIARLRQLQKLGSTHAAAALAQIEASK